MDSAPVRRHPRFPVLGLLVLVIALFAASPPGRAQGQGAAAQVRGAFETFRQALLAGDGAKAAALVTKATLDHAVKIRDMALRMPEQRLRRQPMLNIGLVLLVRIQTGAGELAAMGGRQLVARAVDSRVFASDFVAGIQIGTVTAFTRWAFAAVLNDAGKATKFKVLFRLEDGAWRVDIDAMARQLRRLGPRIATSMGKSKEELVSFLIESSTGQKPAAAVWRPALAN